ncbi:UNVERIFIED_CONTAM: hypothetical protein GTU68_062985 [Idotea baltica]|nr:hypothetical protein [Idotea baltica]
MVLGVVMILCQILIGGITRLTESGLSITKWELVTGSIPPVGEGEWRIEFDRYKGTPQYKKINEGMSLRDFKFIYFWEYLHRLWARWMGLVFILPFLFFIYKGWLSGRIIKRLVVVAGLAGAAGLFGWIMVASGLVDRPWVNAYKLSIHLGLALLVLGYLFWTLLLCVFPSEDKARGGLVQVLLCYLGLVIVQILLGGMMSGMKASLVYPTWPDFHGEMIPAVLLNLSSWNVDNFVDYDASTFMVSLVQLLHRSVAYLLVMSGLWLVWRYRYSRIFRCNKWIPSVFIILLICQVLLGIWTLLGSIGAIPILLGVLHQLGGILILTYVILLYYLARFRILG